MFKKRKIILDFATFAAIFFTFLLPLKFATMAGLPEIPILLPYSNIITALIYIWPPVYFSMLSGILLFCVLLTPTESSDREGDESEEEEQFLNRSLPNVVFLTPTCALLLFLGSLPGILNASVQDFVYLQLIHFAGIAAFTTSIFIIIKKRPQSKIYFLNAIAASTVLITIIGMQQYFSGFQETLDYIRAQEIKTGVKVPSGVMNRLLQTRIYSTFSLCNSLAAHLILTVPLTLFAILKYPSTLKTTYAAACLYYIFYISMNMNLNTTFMVMITTVIALSCVMIHKYADNKFKLLRWIVFFPISTSFIFVFRHTGSRAAMLASAIGILFIIFSSKIKNSIKYILGIVSICCCAYIFFTDIFLRSLSSMEIRFDYYAVALKMFFSHPLLGAGWGDFFHTYTRLKHFPGTEAPHTPHNFILSFASQCGIIGLIVSIIVLIFPFYIYIQFKNLKLDSRGKTKMPRMDGEFFNIVITSGWLAWCVHSLIDLNFQVPATVATAFIMILFLTPPSSFKESGKFSLKIKGQLKKTVKVLLLIFSGILIIFSYNRLISEQEFFILKELCKIQSTPANIHKRKKYHSYILTRLKRTTKQMSYSPYPWAEAGLSAMKSGHFAEGEIFLKKAIALSPERALYYENLAQCQYRTGNPQKAVKNHKKAVRCFPNYFKTERKP